MRMMMTVRLETTASNNALRNGQLPKLIQDLVAQVNPEAAYFTVDGGKRTAFLFFDMTDQSMMPAIGEPLLLGLNAEIDLQPAMNLDDLTAGLARVTL